MKWTKGMIKENSVICRYQFKLRDYSYGYSYPQRKAEAIGMVKTKIQPYVALEVTRKTKDYTYVEDEDKNKDNPGK